MERGTTTREYPSKAMLLPHSANFVLWKVSAIRQSESYISHEAGKDTQLVATLMGIDAAVD
jgi:hypothetical protein